MRLRNKGFVSIGLFGNAAVALFGRGIQQKESELERFEKFRKRLINDKVRAFFWSEETGADKASFYRLLKQPPS